MVEVEVVVGLDLVWLNQPHRITSEIRNVALSPKVAAAQLKIARMTNCGAVPLLHPPRALNRLFTPRQAFQERAHHVESPNVRRTPMLSLLTRQNTENRLGRRRRR
jgi:hypothetical protein